jgi:uncharacterized protein
VSKIVIGTEPSGKALRLDVDLLIPSRLLIQANSGGGKSWLLRRLAEQLYGRVQTIIIDPEGEFFTLREKYGYVLVGEGGETPCDVRSAAMLAERFLELKASAVCDLYEAFRSRPIERRQWVRYFLNALIDAPRKLWHPLIVIVDEAHKFCPQETPKAGNQVDREIIGGCKDAMIALSTTGRKRGFCPIWATQRLAKLDKDASAEFFNRLVGMTIEDVDVDRAADLMSVSKDEKKEFRQSLRTINPGEFYAFGRAITIERTLVKVGDVETRHPESGKQAAGSTAPPMPDDVKKFLPQLSDLPKEAEQKARTEAELKREIRNLKAQLTNTQRMVNVANVKPDTAVRKADPAQIKLQAEKLLAAATKKRDQLWLRAMRDFQRDIERRLSEVIRPLAGAIAATPFKTPEEIPAIEMPAAVASLPSVPSPSARRSIPAQLATPASPDGLKPAHLRVLNNLAELLDLTNSDSVSKEQLAAWSSYSPQGGGYGNVLGALRAAGMLDYGGLGIVITAAGRDLAKPSDVEISNAAMLDRAKGILKPAEAKILEVIHAAYPEAIAKEQIAEQTGYTASGGGFGNYLGHMRTLGFITYTGGGCRCADWMFIEKGNGAAA